MNANKTSREKRSIKNIVKLLASESNAHGVAKIVTARSKQRSAFWTFLVVLCFVAAMVQMAFLLNKYFAYPTAEISTKSREVPVTFPAVTICNTNPISLPKVNELIANGSNIISWFSFTGATDFGEHKSRLDSHQAFYENLPDAAKYIGNSFDDMVISCRFENEACGKKNFTHFFDGKNYYNCFTFTVGIDINASKTSSAKPRMKDAGPHNGLSLILSVNRQNSAAGAYGIYDIKNPVAYGSGMRVQIHASNTLPTPAYHGFDIPPGYSTSVGLKTNEHRRLPYPYGDCSKTLIDTEKQYESTMFTCLQLCKQKILINECGCMTSALPILDFHDSNKQNISFCGKIKDWESNPEQYKNKLTAELQYLTCEQQVMEKLQSNRSYERNCGCSEPCQEISYDQTTSTSYWPEEFFQFSLLETLYKNSTNTNKPVQEALNTLTGIISKYSELAQQSIFKEYTDQDLAKMSRASNTVRKNLIRLNIYLQDFSVTQHIQMPAYDLVGLIADIGSTLILWMGISVLTIMEVFELLLVLLFLAFNSDKYVMGDKKDKGKQGEGQENS